MTLNHIAEAVSLSLYFPGAWGALLVICIWGRVLWKRWLLIPRDRRHMMCGVWVSFLGTLLDGTYWQIPWSMSYIESPKADPWFENGVFANIPFRQTCDIIASWLHLRAFQLADETSRSIRWMPLSMAIATLVGVLYSAALTLTGGHIDS